MPNKYKYNEKTIEGLIKEEDRECLNDLLRSQTEYYKTLTTINTTVLKVLNCMTNDEIKTAIMNNSVIIPIKNINK